MAYVLVTFDRLKERTQDEDGQTLAEYGLILAVVAVATVILAAIAFRDGIVAAFNSAIDCLDGTC
jgi:Flp pilus assembly pilin Flp